MKPTATNDWNSLRMATWWLSWEDLEWPTPGLTEKYRCRAKIFADAGVNTVATFGLHFRWDYPILFERVFGLMAEITQICADHGIKVFEHHSATLVHRARSLEDRRKIRSGNHHHVPFYQDSWEYAHYRGASLLDWCQISARDGLPVYFERYNSHCFCPNNPGYQEAYRDYLLRHLDAAPYAGLISDDLHFLPDGTSCVCRHCRSRFLEEEGLELPAMTDTQFWNNRSNENWQKWLTARYRWNADHYGRLRKWLPREIPILGDASDCLHANLTDIGFAPHLWAEHCDFVQTEIVHVLDLQKSRNEIEAGLAAFASIARLTGKPFLVLIYCDHPDDLPAWLELVAAHNAIPWLCRQVRKENPVREEELLRNGLHLPPAPAVTPGEALVIPLHARDRLLPSAATQEIVQPAIDHLASRAKEGQRIDVLLDGLWPTSPLPNWKKVSVISWNRLTSAEQQTLMAWKKSGLTLNKIRNPSL